MQPDHAPASGLSAPDAGLFSALVRKRWTVSLTLTAVMLAIYYGFIVILAFRPDIFATRTVARLAERLAAAETDSGRLDAVAEVYLEVAQLDAAEVAAALR